MLLHTSFLADALWSLASLKDSRIKTSIPAYTYFCLLGNVTFSCRITCTYFAPSDEHHLPHQLTNVLPSCVKTSHYIEENVKAMKTGFIAKEDMSWSPGPHVKSRKSDRVVYSHNSSTGEAETGGHLGLTEQST